MLDIDSDGTADYALAFGPDWYQPESGAVRPEVGETVIIVGAVHDNAQLPVIIVFEINGLIWRQPVENWWHQSQWTDSLEVVTVSGVVLVDTTYFYFHYYLDEDGDAEPDYLLNFGPHWYEPESGALRPEVGATVTIEGGLKTGNTPPAIVVYSIDGLYWRDPVGPPPWSGSWVHQNRSDSARVHCPTDSMSWLDIPPGAMHGGGQGGHHFADSVFCEFGHVYGDSLPNCPASAQYGFYFNFSDPQGHHVAGNGKAVKFATQTRMALHYGECDTMMQPLAKVSFTDNVILQYWDDNTNQWEEVDDYRVDSFNQQIYFQTDNVNAYYAIIVQSSITSVENKKIIQPSKFKLEQNYPNPFNPKTEIQYQISSDNMTAVSLKIFNLNGQEIRTLINRNHIAGNYQISWDGKDNFGRTVSSGIYLYRLTVGNITETKRLVLMK